MSPSSTPRWIVVGRALLLVAAGGALVFSVFFGPPQGHDGREDERSLLGTSAGYMCPMHPEVTSAGPGTCPICRMALEPRSAAPMPSAGPSSLRYEFVDTVRRRTFSYELMAPARVDTDETISAMLYRDEASALDREPVQFVARKTATLVSARFIDEPFERWDSAIVRVRFVLLSPPPELMPGDVGWVRAPARAHEVLSVPQQAVLPSPLASGGPYVLVPKAPPSHGFTKRNVEIGRTANGFTTVIAGLAEGERFAAGNAFFLDAERRLEGADEAR